jgi:hypothetical protein
VRQVVFTDVPIVGRLDVDGQTFAPVDLHKTGAASDWLLIKRHCIDMKGLSRPVTELIVLQQLSV